MPLQVLNGPTIAAGESLSDALDCSAGRIVKLTMPKDEWTYADISFLTSSDGVGFNDLLKPDGTEVLCVVFPNTAVVGMDLPVGFLKIRSGTRDRPIEQEEIRTFAIAIENIGGG